VTELINSEVGLVNYSTEIINKFIKSLAISNLIKMDVLEFGAGTGSLASIFYDKTTIKPDCIEIDPTLLSIIEKRGFRCFSRTDQLEKKYDAIYSSNVLEHILEEVPALIALKFCLKPGGKIAIYVPAHQFLFSDMDRNVGHYRRYSKSNLLSKVRAAGFEIEFCHYDDFLGFFASLFLKLAGWNKTFKLGSEKSLRIYDTWIYPISRFLDKLGMKRVLGKNLLLVTKPL
jgi:SAM-dependent methyltransferase